MANGFNGDIPKEQIGETISWAIHLAGYVNLGLL